MCTPHFSGLTPRLPTVSLSTALDPSLTCPGNDSWDNLYTSEITNHASDPSDEGTIWFEDSAAENKAVSFLETQIAECRILGPDIGKQNCSFLDLGTGNGHFLFRLRRGEEDREDSGTDDDEEGADRESSAWKGRMLGVDYSEKSIQFARRIAEDKGFGSGSGAAEVEFRLWDLMTQDPSGSVLDGSNATGWNVVLDKGTFDAISLSKEKDHSGRRICEGYKERVVPLIKDGGILLITSCNWTEDELRAWFEGGQLEYVNTIKYKSFSFGGQKGQTISSICLRRHHST